MQKKLFVTIATVAIYATPLLVVSPSFASMRHHHLAMNRPTDRPTMMNKVKNKAKKMGLDAKLTATVSAMTSNTLTVSKDAKSYQINIGTDTKLYRKFGAKSTLSEFAVGDSVNIVGKWADDGQTAINASYVRDTSVQKKNANFRGGVISKGTNSFVINPNAKTGKRSGDKTVNVVSNVVYKNRLGKAISLADIQVGDMVNVMGGIWNTQENVINGVTKVTDTTLPVKK